MTRRDITAESITELLHEGMSRDEIAERYGCSKSLVNRRLRQAGLAKPKKKCCPALVAMLYEVMGMSHKRICEMTGYKSSSVGNIISKKFGSRKERGHIVREHWGIETKSPLVDKIEREYMDGATTYELGEKYGVYHTTITKWMRARGHRRGKGYTSGRTVKRRCATCGELFDAVTYNARYCSHRCKNRAAYSRRFRTDHKTRAERYGLDYDPTITVEKLYRRDGGICQICGELCDPNDKSWGSCGPMHPSIDHIVPMSRGGAHVWSNVQLAHHLCNARKQDNMEVAV